MKCMISWALKALRILPDEITCIKYDPHTELPVHLRNLEDTDPTEGIQEESVCREDISGLSIDPDD